VSNLLPRGKQAHKKKEDLNYGTQCKPVYKRAIIHGLVPPCGTTT